jgi:hypothetical protein
MTSSSELKTSFKRNKFPIREDILKESEETCKLFGLGGEQLCLEIETFLLNNQKQASQLTAEHIKTIKEDLMKKNKTNPTKKTSKKRKVYNKENVKK